MTMNGLQEKRIVGKWSVWPTSIVDNLIFQSEISGEIKLVKRKFKLPGEDDLNKDQDIIYDLPEDGKFLIVGSPGTGKSIVALLRAMKYHKNDDYVFLTFNKVLKLSTSQLVDINLNSFTLDSWFGKEYWKIFKEFAPSLSDRKPDYNSIIKVLESRAIQENSTHIIIDEGQDKPIKFYESLKYFGFKNFFIIADQNQQITEDNSSREELTNVLGLEEKDIIELKENYRNSYPIAVFSNSFYTDLSSPLPRLPIKSKVSLGIPILYEYTYNADCINLILREYDRDNRNLIGIVVANNNIRNSYVQSLKTQEIVLNNPRPIISTYSSKDTKNPNINFGYSGIIVLNDKSIKGLEFDIVYIVLDGFNIYNHDINSMKKRFYVMSSRAIKKLCLFKDKNYRGGVNTILPQDESILKREIL